MDFDDDPFYGGGDEELDFEEGDDGGDSEEEEESEDFVDDDFEETEKIDLRGGYKEMQNVSGGIAPVKGISKRFQKSVKSPEEIAREQIKGVLSYGVYVDLSEAQKQLIISEIEKLKHIHLYNADVLILASLFQITVSDLNKKNFGNFVKKYCKNAGVDQIDLLRYIRLLNNSRT